MSTPPTMPESERERVRQLLEAHPWRFAKTMPESPHYYTLRREWADQDAFEFVVAAIRQLSAGHPAPRLIGGHSLGGTVALLALQADPGIAQSLLMVDPAMVPTKMRRLMLLPFAPHVFRRRIPIARSAQN